MHESFTIKGGSDFLDLNNRGTVNLFYNSLTSLFEGKNYLRQYKSNFLSFSAQREITDGLMVTGGVEMARRFPIRNSTNDSSFADFNRLYPGDNLFPANNALSLETKLSYTYGQHYTRRPDGKIYEPARYPTLKLTYRKGIKGVINSAVDYDFGSIDLYQDKLKTGLMGYSRLKSAKLESLVLFLMGKRLAISTPPVTIRPSVISLWALNDRKFDLYCLK